MYYDLLDLGFNKFEALDIIYEEGYLTADEVRDHCVKIARL